MIALKHLKKCSSVINIPVNLKLENELNFCTDTRRYSHPSAFVAIPGSRVNPLDMLSGLLEKKIPLVVYESSEENEEKANKLQSTFPDTAFLGVTESVTFLQELTHHHIVDWKKQNSKHTIFAISGSNGKTTHKEMLAFILNKIKPGQIVATEKNNNNHLGVPLTLLGVNHKTEVVVLELGSNHPGEIKVLCDIAAPNAGLTTNIGATHLEFFGTEERVFEEEGHLYYAVKADEQSEKFFLINKDDPFLQRLIPFDGCITYGETSDCEARVSYQENGAQIQYRGKTLTVTNNYITGKHNKLNLITCVFIACHFYPDQESLILSVASEFKPTKNRSEWIEFEGRKIYLDAYNANPSSMKAALQGFKESVIENRMTLEDACIVLGDMNELGESAADYHQEIGKYVQELGFKNVYFIGRFAESYREGFKSANVRRSAADFKSEYRSGVLKNYRIHFIKGSRSLQLESLFDIT